MANKPTLYGFDDAGCKWETAHKADVPAIKYIALPSFSFSVVSDVLTITCSSDEFSGLKTGDLFFMPVLFEKSWDDGPNINQVQLAGFSLSHYNVFGKARIKTSSTGSWQDLDVNSSNGMAFLSPYNLLYALVSRCYIIGVV